MTKDLTEVLKTYMARREEDTVKYGWSDTPAWLFYNQTGNRIDENHLRKRVFHKCLEMAGLSQRGLHDLRHTNATLRILGGELSELVSRDLGHSSTRVTSDHYFHYEPDGDAPPSIFDSQTGKVKDKDAG
jgi:integrase